MIQFDFHSFCPKLKSKNIYVFFVHRKTYVNKLAKLNLNNSMYFLEDYEILLDSSNPLLNGDDWCAG